MSPITGKMVGVMDLKDRNRPATLAYVRASPDKGPLGFSVLLAASEQKIF